MQGGRLVLQDIYNTFVPENRMWEVRRNRPPFTIEELFVWHRSALAFLTEQVASGPDPSQHASVLHDLDLLAGESDLALLEALEALVEGCMHTPVAPDGLPETHWWWFLHGHQQWDGCAHEQEDIEEHARQSGFYWAVELASKADIRCSSFKS